MKLKLMVLACISFIAPSQVNAQVFDLVRVVQSSNISSKAIDDFSQVGTMTIENGFVTRTRLRCFGIKCTDTSKTEQIFSIEENKVLLGDNKFNTKDVFVISTSPTIILLEFDGSSSFEVTEYKLRE